MVPARNTDDVRRTHHRQMVQFWTDAATTYRINPYVWFDPMNEPTFS